MKKQIVFIEPIPTPLVYKIARTLKLSGKYETILITSSKLTGDTYKKGYDKIYVYELIDVPNSKNLLKFFGQFFKKDFLKFIREIRKLRPYIVQITAINLFTPLNFLIFKNRKHVYYGYDIWGPYKKKFSLKKNSGRLMFLHKFSERICFRMSDGIIYKGSPETFSMLGYKVNKPKLSFLPGCLDEWNVKPKIRSLNKKEIHIIFAGGSILECRGHISFLEIAKRITDQKIHFHIYDHHLTKEMEIAYGKFAKKNEYFHFYGAMDLDEFNKIISKYNFGIHPDFIYDKKFEGIDFNKISMANKIFAYIEAGIPLIVTDQLEYMKKIVEENKIGIAVSFEDLKNLRKIIEEKDYKQMLLNVKKSQEKYSLKKNINKIERFYNQIQD